MIKKQQCAQFKTLWKTALLYLLFLGIVVVAYAEPVLAEESAKQLPNPLGEGTKSFTDVVNSIFANVVFEIATTLATLAVIITGLQFVTASFSGDTAKLTNAKKNFWTVLVGIAVVVLSATLAVAIIKSLGGKQEPEEIKAKIEVKE